MAKISKNRYWSFVYFIEKKGEKKKKLKEIIEFLDKLHVKYTISPLHCNDKNPDGTKKKPHWHIMVCWDGPTTYNNASECLGSIAANGHIESVVSARGMYRYFVHADNPEKYQYDDMERIHGCGFNPADLMSETDKKAIMMFINKLIREHHLFNFAQVDELLIDSGFLTEWNVFSSNTNYYRTYLDGRKQLLLLDQAGMKDTLMKEQFHKEYKEKLKETEK